MSGVNTKTKFHSIATILIMVVMFFFISCGKDKAIEKIDAVEDRARIPKLEAQNVTTIVSDSGITRYRIATKEWLIYDKAEQPYWDFPQGIVLETFDEELEVEASIESNYAYFNENKQIWELRGDVVAVNVKGEMFETEQLFWNQKTERIYSDSLIHITRETSIITGIGFDSNQSMTEYTIRKPQGVFPIEEKTDTIATDTLNVMVEETVIVKENVPGNSKKKKDTTQELKENIDSRTQQEENIRKTN